MGYFFSLVLTFFLALTPLFFICSVLCSVLLICFIIFLFAKVDLIDSFNPKWVFMNDSVSPYCHSDPDIYRGEESTNRKPKIRFHDR